MTVRLHRLASLALVIALLHPAAAWGATVREYQLQLTPVAQPTGSLMIVSALLDPQTPLPATVTLPVPAGVTLLWAGEILGGDSSADPTREVTMERIGEMDVYTLTLEQSYTAQVEVQLVPPAIAGNRVQSSVTWENPGAEVLVSAAVVAEPGAADVETTPQTAGEVRTNEIGESLYPLAGLRVPEGGAYVISAEWNRGGEATNRADFVLPLVLGLLAVAVIALVVVFARERTRAGRAAASDL
jgi:hypothetical protein